VLAPRQTGCNRTMAVERTVTDEELRRIAALAPPADDDVAVLADGTRLDTLAKIWSTLTGGLGPKALRL